MGRSPGRGTSHPRPNSTFIATLNPRTTVFRSRSTKTLIPLDVTNRVVLGFDFLNQLPDELTRVGKLLRKIIPPAFRAFHQESGLEGIHVHDSVALVAVTNPELFTMQAMPGNVEIKGSLTTGTTVFDRRRVPAWRCNMDVATDMDAAKVAEQILRSLDNAGKGTA